jgi:hypothetical protein
MGLLTSSREGDVGVTIGEVRRVLACGLAGDRWYVDAWPFVLRGTLDVLVGGAGRQWPVPGRPLLRVGDRAGFWTVTRSDPGGLALDATVRAPGRVSLLTEWFARPGGGTRVRLDVTFHPHGALGTAYLLADLPARELVAELTHRRMLGDLRQLS